MLVLSRKVGERILIGDRISVTVVRIMNGGVRIGIEAPSDMTVIRQELKDQLDEAAKQPVPTSIQQPIDQGVVEIDIGLADQDQPIEPQSISSMTQLPAVVTFHFHQEELFLRSVFDQAERGAAQFRLAPAYSLYSAFKNFGPTTSIWSFLRFLE